MMSEIDFKQIIPRLGSKSAAFEEICCQLARCEDETNFQRLLGAGGDGGIECYRDTSEGRLGWQAKYVFTADLAPKTSQQVTRYCTVSPSNAEAFRPVLSI